ncbi:hypothetical protein SAMN05444671_1745 [Flavobacterium sp. CF108]|jgi:hypothetical protein|uniref:hypothetical protein n=1 Tax=unclassified Flavobacterium TaxID=196869 RepID=UPI0008C0A32A|nr:MULTISPECIES: hypothetical protein [unclassified Flavobacterium]SEN52064.1 hypothetical protein SAMN04487978_1060 [Flavobacterium sp. fv08]SHG97969.1 hypothetical protein SAMN05444671_1745 [Flavobacterium sp. CF108]
MGIQLEKREVMDILKGTNDLSIILAVKKMLTQKKKDWWDDLTDEQKEEIKEGERQIERGEFVEYEEMMKKFR